MNFKTLLIIVFVLIILNLGFLYLSGRNQAKTPYNQSVNSANTISLPLDPKHKGVSEAIIIYTFTGKIKKIEQIGEKTRLTLDISDSQTPQFLITKNTNILNLTSQSLQNPPSAVPVSSLKEGMEISIAMNYNIITKSWNTVGITIAPLSRPTPPANSPLPKQ